MVAMLIGIILLAFAVYAVLPFDWALSWWSEFIETLKGAAPLVALVMGSIAVLLGFADIKDRIEARKEEAAMQESLNSSQKESGKESDAEGTAQS